MRLRAGLLGPVLVLALLVLVGGCGGKDDPKPATGPGLPSQAELTSFFDAITSSDPSAIERTASRVAAAGSPAAGYAAYNRLTTQAAVAAGKPFGTADVHQVDGGFKACASADQCVTWTHLTGKDGRLTDFDVNDVSLDDLLVDLTGQPAVTSPGLYRVQPEWAYRLPLSGTLDVIVSVTASDVPLSPRPGTYIESDQILKGAKALSPSTVKPGTTSPVVLAFPKAQHAKLDGQVTFDLDVAGAGAEPVGFGLSDPAP